METVIWTKGIPVCNVPGTLTHGASNLAEHVMFLALALAKRYRELLTSIEERRIGGPSSYVLPIDGMNSLATTAGLLSSPVAFEQVAATQFENSWFED